MRRRYSYRFVRLFPERLNIIKSHFPRCASNFNSQISNLDLKVVWSRDFRNHFDDHRHVDRINEVSGYKYVETEKNVKFSYQMLHSVSARLLSVGGVYLN